MNVVIYLDGGKFISDTQNLALIGVKFHLIIDFPLLENVEVPLEYEGVGGVSNGAIE